MVQQKLETKFVEFIPDKLLQGTLYISEKYNTASHLCCCGCGYEVVTPLNPAKWSVKVSHSGASLYPSIGNWSFPCRSHYWIKDGNIKWSSRMTDEEIDLVRDVDAAAVSMLSRQENNSIFTDLKNWLTKIFKHIR